MNKIVRDGFPVSELPEDLQRLLDPTKPVKLTIEQAEHLHDLGEATTAFQDHVRGRDRAMPLTRILEAMQERRAFSDDPVTRVRALRAEWDGRDELHERIRSRRAD